MRHALLHACTNTCGPKGRGHPLDVKDVGEEDVEQLKELALAGR
jgi:hypothetical protein